MRSRSPGGTRMTRTSSPVIRLASALALALAVLAAFAGVRGNGWVLIDDPVYVTENPHVVTGLTGPNVAWFLHAPHGGNWHPLTSWSHLLDVSAFGLDPAGPHTVNLMLHVANALLLFLALRLLTGAWWRPLAVAALFALHPLRVESVAWISERKDVLSGLFFLLTVIRWKLWTESPSPARYALVCVALALGLASKPMLVTTPAVLLLLDAWPLGRLPLEAASLRDGTLAARLREKAPLFALAFVFAALTWWVQRATGAMTDGTALPLAARAANAVVAPWRYVRATLWPEHLGVFYPFPDAIAPLTVAASVAALAAGIALAWRVRRTRPEWIVGVLWFLGMLVPVSGIVQVGRQGWADRYSYLPTIGLAIAIVWSAAALAARARVLRVAAVALLLAVCAALGLATTKQVARWKSSETLFAWTAEAVPGNVTALVGLGNAYMKEGARAQEALAPFREALALEPGNFEVRDRLVLVLMRLQKNDEALQVTLDGLRRHPSAQGWFDVGVLEAKRGRDSVAVEAFARSAKLDPDAIPTRLQWQQALARLGRPLEAVAQLDEAIRLAPDDAGLLLQSAWLRATSEDPRLRDGALAVLQAERARTIEKTPDALIEATLGAAYAEAGRWADAVGAAERAVQLARAQESHSEVALFEQQLALYRSHRPLRER